MSNMVKYRVVRFKKDHMAALYFTMSDIVHDFLPSINSKQNIAESTSRIKTAEPGFSFYGKY
jgi:hypothetical protein